LTRPGARCYKDVLRRWMALPLYEYACPGCGTFERVQKFADPILSECPTCGKPVEKLLSAPAIQFKGSGWYITDYARKSSGKDSSDKGDKKDGGDTKAGGTDKAAKASGGTKESSSASAKSSDKT